MPIFEHVIEHNAVKRHLLSSVWSFYILLKNRPRLIFLQYSFMLLMVVGIYKLLRLNRVVVVCDCHTKALRRRLSNPIGGIFSALKRFSFRCTDVCIVSNQLMIPEIRPYTDNYLVLPDKIPDWHGCSQSCVEKYCLFVGSYAVDEPLEAVIQAARELKGLAKIYCTGRIPAPLSYLREQPYENIHFTDYQPEERYRTLLSDAQCVIALTTEEGCLQCAGYEAMALNVPLVVSKSDALSTYFGGCAVHVDNDAGSIVQGVERALREGQRLREKMADLKTVRIAEYRENLARLVEKIQTMEMGQA